MLQFSNQGTSRKANLGRKKPNLVENFIDRQGLSISVWRHGPKGCWKGPTAGPQIPRSWLLGPQVLFRQPQSIDHIEQSAPTWSDDYHATTIFSTVKSMIESIDWHWLNPVIEHQYRGAEPRFNQDDNVDFTLTQQRWHLINLVEVAA